MSCCCSLALVACGDDDDGGGSSEDGGVSNFDEVNDRLKGIDTAQKGLGDDVQDVKDGLGDAQDKLDELDGKATGFEDDIASINARLDDVPNCSANEECMPDGVDVAAMGLAGIIEQLCTLEIECCNADELNYKFGPGITDVASCTSTFSDLVNNGFSPDFISSNGVLVNRVISIAQAINSNDVQVEIDADAVEACIDYLSDRECPKYTEVPEIPVDRCEPIDYEDEEDPCDLSLLVKGHQEEGEVCGLTGINECAPGLNCRHAFGSVLGICAPPSEVGDGCRRDDDCDGVEQFCNLTSGKCQERGDEGDDCEYVDPTFSNDFGQLDPRVTGLWQNPGALKVECKRGLLCDPTSNKCVKNCSAGALCYTNFDCPEDTICNFTDVANLADVFGVGVCTAPIAKDAECTLLTGAECASGRCAYDAITDFRNECVDPLKAVGDACSLTTAGVSQPDVTCATGRCGTDGKCVAVCELPGFQGDCPATYYCSSEFLPSGSYACEPKKANDVACTTATVETNLNDNYECTSGFCDSSAAQCKPKLGAGGNCTTTQDTACPAGQYCKAAAGPTYTCTALVAAGGACAEDRECVAGAYCGTAGSNLNKCVAYVAAGGTCEATNDVRCDPADDELSCVAVGSSSVCAKLGAYPAGAACLSDTYCASTWCRLSDSTCQPPIAEGNDCDHDNAAKSRCEAGTYCKYPNLAMTATAYGEGTCTAKGTAGQACDPRFGDDCIGGCSLRNDAFVCDAGSIVEETLFCDGE